MNNEEKILAMLSQMQEEQKQMREDISDLKSAQSTMQTDVSDLKSAQSAMQTDISDLRSAQSAMQTTLTRVALTQENVVLKSLDALVEGQDITHQKMKDLAGKDALAELRDEVQLMRSVIAQHSRDIEALKAAQ